MIASRVTAIILIAVAIRALQEGAFASVAHDIVAESPIRVAGAHAAAAPDAPDIYLLLLDGYVRADRMESLFGYDNAPFLAALESRGFDVASDSRSNYLATELTLSSMFNMTLLDTSSGDPNLKRLVRMRRLVNDAPVWSFLHDRGYETLAIGSGFETVTPRAVDRFIDTGQMNELEIVALRTTALGRLPAASAAASGQHRDRVIAVLRAAGDVAATSSNRRKFVFAHVPSPHVPVVFDAAGRPATADLATFYEEAAGARGVSRDVYGVAYTAQVAHLNELVVATVDRIVKASATPPVIILFGDHGSASGLDWADLEHSDLDERTATLFAAYTPGRHELFGEAPTPVNLLGTLMNSYLGGSFATQPDLQFRLLDEQLHFSPVTVTP